METPSPAPPWTPSGPSEVIETALAVSRHSLRARLYQSGRRLFWGAAPFILAGALLPGQVWFALAGLAMASCALAMVAGAVVGMTPPPWRVFAALDDRGLRLTTPTTVVALPREALLDGMVIAPFGGFALRLHDRAGDRYELAMPDEPTAWRWLQALGLSADRRAVRVVSNRALLQAAVSYFASSITALPLMLAWIAVLAVIGHRDEDYLVMPLASMHSAMFGTWLMSWMVGRADITIGGDGLSVGTWPWRRYIPFEALEGVSREGMEGVALRLRGRWRPLTLRFASAVEAEAVAVRIAAARAAWEASVPPSCIARLAVGDPEDAEAWRAALRDAVGDGSYRDAALTLADLEAVVASVSVTAAQRTGAALALRDLQPATERSGVRVATELLVGAEALESLARADPGRPEVARTPRRR